MKRVLVVILVVVVCMASASASFRFSFGPLNPMYPPMQGDPFSYTSALKFLQQFSSDPQGNNVLMENTSVPATDAGRYELLEYRPWSAKSNQFLNLRLGTGISILRMGWEEYCMADVVLQASLNSVFAMQGGTALVGFDGTFFFGGEARIMDMFVTKVGLKHYSGHTGDEILQEAINRKGGPDTYESVAYTRDNMLELALGYDGCTYAQVYFSAMLPLKTSWWEPYFHQPDWVVTSTGDATPDRGNGQWAVRGPYGSGYGAYILQLDVHLQYPFLEKYKVYGNLEMKFHQDGQTKHTLTPTDDTSDWEIEWDVMLGVAITNIGAGKSLALEVSYHDGRFPLLNFFWKRSTYLSVGVSIT